MNSYTVDVRKVFNHEMSIGKVMSAISIAQGIVNVDVYLSELTKPSASEAIQLEVATKAKNELASMASEVIKILSILITKSTDPAYVNLLTDLTEIESWLTEEYDRFDKIDIPLLED